MLRIFLIGCLRIVVLVLVILLALVIALMELFGVILPSIEGKLTLNEFAFTLMLCLSVGGLVTRLLVAFKRLGRSTRPAETIRDERFALLLRSGLDDGRAVTHNVRMWEVDTTTLNEILVDLLGKSVRLVAVEDPRRAPQLGSVPVSVPRYGWLTRVTALAARAEVVVYVFGETDGVLKEWDMLCERGALGKTIVVFAPFARWGKDRRQEVVRRQAAFLRILHKRVDRFELSAPVPKVPLGAVFHADGERWILAYLEMTAVELGVGAYRGALRRGLAHVAERRSSQAEPVGFAEEQVGEAAALVAEAAPQHDAQEAVGVHGDGVAAELEHFP